MIVQETSKSKAKTVIERLAGNLDWRRLREAQKAARQIAKHLESIEVAQFLLGQVTSQRADLASRTVRVAVASDASFDNLAEALAMRLLERGIFGIQYHAGFAQVALEVRNATSGLFQHNPEVVVLAPLTRIWTRVVNTDSATVTQVVEEAWSHVMALREQFSGIVLLQNLMMTESRPHGVLETSCELGRTDFVRAINLELSRRCRESTGAFILDAEYLSARSGTVWPSLHKQNLMASRPISNELASQLAADIAAYCAASKGFARKCLIVDLDNTLWGGVVGEDGVSGLKLGGSFPGNLYTELQHEIRALNDRGIVLAIVSKNNEADVWEVFDQRPEMVLRRSNFSAHRINWRDKATNIRELAAELNLGLDAMVLIDDNPVELSWIEESLPEVEVCPATDPIEMIRWLATTRLFDTMAITREDLLRMQSYAAATERVRLASNSGNVDDYLAGLNMRVEIGLVGKSHVARVAQLTQKTNQFNLTTRRYTESELEALICNPLCRVYWCACTDRFADEGVIGAALVNIVNSVWILDVFLLSCRALGRSVERAFLGAICDLAASEGAGMMHGEYIRTAKNFQTEAFFESCGFTAEERTPDHGLWRVALPASAELKPRWIDLHVNHTLEQKQN